MIVKASSSPFCHASSPTLDESICVMCVYQKRRFFRALHASVCQILKSSTLPPKSLGSVRGAVRAKAGGTGGTLTVTARYLGGEDRMFEAEVDDDLGLDVAGIADDVGTGLERASPGRRTGSTFGFFCGEGSVLTGVTALRLPAARLDGT